MFTRRELFRSGLSAGAMVLGAPLINRGRFSVCGKNGPEYSARTMDLVRRCLVVDMLGLLTLDWQKLERWQRSPGSFTPADWEKLKASGINVFHPAVDVNTPDPYSTVCQWMSDWNRFIDQHNARFLRVDRPGDLLRVKREGRIGIVLGLQNSDHFRNLEDVTAFYKQGQRISQLTYNNKNQIGAGCTERFDEGLSTFGETVVRRMNELGMAIDVSHTGERTTMDALSVSQKPLLITHANCGALAKHPRCKSDELIRRVASSGGVMGITSIRTFVRDVEPTTIEHALDHFDYASRVAGIEHVGVGSDTDLDGRDKGLSLPPRSRMDINGLNHPRRMFDLTEGLVRRRYTDQHIEMILGGNFRRALSQIWV